MLPYVVDLAELGAIAQTAQAVRKEIGGIDVLINNAGIVRGKYFWEHDNGDDTRPTMQVNALAPMYVTREFLPGMQRSPREARIVNIACAAGTIANPRMSVYAASKWAIVGMTRSLAIELGPQGVRVNAILPGVVEGARMDGVIAARASALGISPQAMRQQYLDKISLRRMVTAGHLGRWEATAVGP